MHEVRESQAEQRARLGKTAQGRALLELLGKHKNKRALAEALGSSHEYVSRCVRLGRISKAGAELAEKKGLGKKESLRPDIQDWDAAQPGLPIGGKAKRNGVHQTLLRDLAIHCGSVRSLCQRGGFPIRTFHDWLTRDKISRQGLEKIQCIDDLPPELLKRVLAEVDTA